MSQDHKQTRLEVYSNIIKYHGVVNGIRRVIDQFFQNDLYDIKHSTNFSQMLSGPEYYAAVPTANKASVMPYQPGYTDSLRKPLHYLIRNRPVVGASSACFMDLGVGRAKSLHIARSMMQHVNLMGVELEASLVRDAAKNLRMTSQKDIDPLTHELSDTNLRIRLVHRDVNDVDYGALLKANDVIIVFHKNSFDMATTGSTLNKIIEGCPGKKIFYIYNNPVFESLLAKYPCIFQMSGWHKSWKTKVFEVA